MIILILLHGLKAAISVGGEGVALLLFPLLDEALDGFERESLLLIGELAILAHGVEADDELLVKGVEGVELDLFPDALFRDPLLARGHGLITLRSLLILKGLALRVLRSLLLLGLLPVGHCFGQSLIEEAALVDERHGHEAAQPWHSLEVHAWLTYNLRHVEVLETLENVVMLHGCVTLLVSPSGGLGAASVGLTKDIVSHTHGGLQHGAFDELVRLIGVDKLDHLGESGVFVCLVVSVDGDLLLGVLEAANVNASGASVLLQELHESREVVSQVLRLLEAAEERFLVILLIIDDLLLLSLLTLLDFAASVVARLLVGDLLKLLLPLHSNTKSKVRRS